MILNISIEFENDDGENKTKLDTTFRVGPINDYYIEKGSIYSLLTEIVNTAYMNYKANLPKTREFNRAVNDFLTVSKVKNEKKSDPHSYEETTDYQGNEKSWVELKKFAEIVGLKRQTAFLKIKKEPQNPQYGCITIKDNTYDCEKRKNGVGRPKWFVNYQTKEKEDEGH